MSLWYRLVVSRRSAYLVHFIALLNLTATRTLQLQLVDTKLLFPMANEPSFLGLPRELRNLVYSFAFRPIHLRSPPLSLLLENAPYPNLLVSCKQIHAEYLESPLFKNTSVVINAAANSWHLDAEWNVILRQANHVEFLQSYICSISSAVFDRSNGIWRYRGSIECGCTALGLSFDTVKLRIRCFTLRRPGPHTMEAMKAEAFVPERGPDILGLQLRQFARANRYRSQQQEIRPFECTHESTNVVYLYGRLNS